MKRLFLLFVFVSACPLSAVIVNGYKYSNNNAIIYLLADVHVDNDLKDKGIVQKQLNFLVKQLDELPVNSCDFFIETSEPDDQKNTGILDKFGKVLSTKKINFKSEKKVYEKFKNIYTAITWSIAVTNKQNDDGTRSRGEIYDDLLGNKKVSFDIYLFNQELNELLKNFKKQSSSYYTIYSFKSFVVNKKEDIEKLEMFLDMYRDKCIIDFIKQSKAGKIIVFAGIKHIQYIQNKYAPRQKWFLSKKVGRDLNIEQLLSNTDFLTQNKDKKIDNTFIDLLSEKDLKELFSPQTTWQWIKEKAYAWRKTLLPAAVVGAGLAAWWLNQKNKSSAKLDTTLKTKNPLLNPPQWHWWSKMTAKPN